MSADGDGDTMTLHAFDDIDDAVQATRSFLFPFERGTCLRLALVVFFIGGAGMNVPVTGFNAPPTTPGAPGGPGDGLPQLTDTVLFVIAAIVVIALVLALVFAFVGSVMEFVLVESLRSESVHVRRYWGRYWRRGARLFGFRVVLGLMALAIGGGLVAIVALPALTGAGSLSVGLLIALLPVFFLVALLFGLLYGFTSAFVVPTMLLENCGVLAGWRRMWPVIRTEWKEYVAYAVLAWLFQAVLAMIVAMIVGIGAMILAIPFVLIGVVVWAALAFSTPALVLMGALVVVYLAFLLVVVLLAQVPVQTGLRYYALFLLGDTAPSLDPVPDQRMAVRDEGA